MQTLYKLRQVSVANGLNRHRAWECQITGKRVLSNDDVLGKRFYMDNGNGEGIVTKWFSSPRQAIRHS